MQAALRKQVYAQFGAEMEATSDDEWYARHCMIRIANQSGLGARLIPFQLNGVQRELDAEVTGRDVIDKARKHGVSTYYACRFYKAVTTKKHVAAAIVAHKPDSVAELWKIVQRLYDNDPRQLRTRYASRRELYFADLDSYFVVLQGGKGSGRAGTFNYLHVSELAHFDANALDTLTGMLAAVPPHHTGSEVALESTANGEGNEFHRQYLMAVKGESEFAAHFFPWFAHPDYVIKWQPSMQAPAKHEREWMKAHDLSKDRLAFYRAMQKTMGRMVVQEYPFDWEESFLASGSKVFDGLVLRDLETAVAEEHMKEEDFGDGSYLRIYRPPRRGRRYVAGADTAEGVLGGDAQDLRIYDFESLEEVAVLHGYFPIHVFARKLSALCARYKAFTVIERNNHGHAVLEHLLHGRDEDRLPRDLLYYETTWDRGKETTRPGFTTSLSSKPIIIADLEETIRLKAFRPNDPLFYREARAYAHLEDGTMGAPPGEHDDSVMGTALMLHARKHIPGHVGVNRKVRLL